MFKKFIARAIYSDIDCYFLFRCLSENEKNIQSYDDEYAVEVLEQPCDATLERLVDFYRVVKAEEDSTKLQGLVGGRYADGGVCVVSKYRDKIVGARWVCDLAIQKNIDFAKCLSSEPNAYLFYDAFVLPEHRGHELQKRMNAAMKSFALSKGCQVNYNFVGCRNFASIKNSLKVNDEYKTVYHVTLKAGKKLKYNFYPKWNKEPWRSCANELRL